MKVEFSCYKSILTCSDDDFAIILTIIAIYAVSKIDQSFKITINKL